MGLAQKLFGTHSEHELKRIYPIADKIESYRESYGRLSDEELKGKTKEFKDRLAKGETLDDILPEAFATVREAGRRVLGMEHYRVQLIGGIILHQGRIAEMKTGEGKTLVCTLPAYLNALTEEGVIVVTVNDYLAKRDAEQMGMIHEFLGLKVGVVLHDSTREERQAAYGSDITYVTNNELGFDYLRDNMAIYKSELVLRNLMEAKISDPEVIARQEEWLKYTKAHSKLTEIVTVYREYQKLVDAWKDDEAIAKAREDQELTAMAEEEMKELQPQLEAYEEKLTLLLLPKDPNVVSLSFRPYVSFFHGPGYMPCTDSSSAAPSTARPPAKSSPTGPGRCRPR